MLSQIKNIKQRALNLIDVQLTKNGEYLEPREIKILSDTALSIEDSLLSNGAVSEGEQARKIQRILDKYTSTEVIDHIPPKSPTLSSHSIVDQDA